MLQEFKDFALKGSAVDLAVGVIIGAAFSKIVDSLVNDMFMPVIGALTPGGLDLSNHYFMLRGQASDGMSLAEARRIGTPLAYGSFINVVVNFLIISAILFFVIRFMGKLRSQKGPEVAPPPPADVQLLTEIRDLLADRR